MSAETLTEAQILRAEISGLDVDQSGLARMFRRLGDHRDQATILRSLQRMLSGDVPVSGPMKVIMTLLLRERAAAYRLAKHVGWEQTKDGGYEAEVEGVKLTLTPQSHRRWSIHARHVADGDNGYSPSIPHWRSSLDEAKVRATLAVDETLDQVAELSTATN